MTPQAECPVPGVAHSSDRVAVWHGAPEPLVMCGLHAQDPADAFKRLNAKEPANG